jgi:hypothetical protein
VVFPSEVRSMPGNQAAYKAQKREFGLRAVSVTTPLWAPGADSGQRTKNEIARQN